MNDFLKQLGLKFLSYFIFIAITILLSVTLVSGQPPTISNIKTQFQNFKEFKETASKMLAKSSEAIKKMESKEASTDGTSATAVAAEDPAREIIQAQAEMMNSIRTEQALLKSQLTRIEFQNQSIITAINNLNSRPQNVQAPAAAPPTQ